MTQAVLASVRDVEKGSEDFSILEAVLSVREVIRGIAILSSMYRRKLQVQIKVLSRLVRPRINTTTRVLGVPLGYTVMPIAFDANMVPKEFLRERERVVQSPVHFHFLLYLHNSTKRKNSLPELLKSNREFSTLKTFGTVQQFLVSRAGQEGFEFLGLYQAGFVNRLGLPRIGVITVLSSPILKIMSVFNALNI